MKGTMNGQIYTKKIINSILPNFQATIDKHFVFFLTIYSSISLRNFTQTLKTLSIDTTSEELKNVIKEVQRKCQAIIDRGHIMNQFLYKFMFS